MSTEASERDIQSSILDYLAILKIPAFRRNTGATVLNYQSKAGAMKKRLVRFSEKGQSDIWGVIPANFLEPGGRHFEIEVKRPGGKPTPEQQEWIDRMRRAGCIAFVAHSVEEVQKALEGLR